MRILWKSYENPLKFVAKVDEIQPKVDEILSENWWEFNDNWPKVCATEAKVDEKLMEF